MCINILKKLFATSNNEASKTPYYLLTSREIEGVSGKYYTESKQTVSSNHSSDKLIASKLWDISLDYIK